MTAHTRQMGAAFDEQEADDPRVQRVYRRLRLLTLIGALTMGVGFASVMSVIAYRLVKSSPASSGMVAKTLAIPAGGRVATSADAGRVVVTVEAEGRTTIHVFDAGTLAETGRIDVAPGGPTSPPGR